MARERMVPGTLSRDLIIDVALALTLREGIESLSMRRIAAELGTGAMSLYNHVPDKAALLKGLADRVLSEVSMPEEGSWREVAESWATSLRGTLLAHHQVVAIVISGHETQPFTASRQALVRALVRAGLPGEDALMVMRVLGRFVAGSVFLDAAYLSWGRQDRSALDEYFAIGLDTLLDGMRSRFGGDGSGGGRRPPNGDAGTPPGAPSPSP